jgi:hypothetical protein
MRRPSHLEKGLSMQINSGLSTAQRQGVVNILHQALADEGQA